MNRDQLRAVLFITALLRKWPSLDHHSRSLIISSFKPLDICFRTEVFSTIDRAFREAGIGQVSRKRLTDRSVENAAAEAERWLNQGVSAIFPEEISSVAAASHSIGHVLFVRGNVHILERPAAAVLNSRRPRSTHPEDNWIKVTKSMVAGALKRGFAIASSYGPIPYCIVSLIAKGSPIIVVCDAALPFMQPPDVLNRFVERYGDLFDFESTLFISPFAPGRMPSAPFRFAERDHLVAALSSVVMTGEIRPGGIMESVLATVAKRRVPIEYSAPQISEAISNAKFNRNEPRNDDRSAPALSQRSKAQNFDRIAGSRTDKIARNTNAVPTEEGGAPSDTGFSAPLAGLLGEQAPYLVHYTRSWPGPWPGQPLAEYCQSLISELPNARHSAFDSLVRILEQDRIFGSRRLNRGGFSVTCFTECLPSELRSLVEWRRGLIRWNFEPYGLAFRKAIMFDLGARPVIYAVEDAFNDLSDDLKYLFQIQRADGKQWSSEREWRIRGDVRLADLGQDAFFVIVRKFSEAEIIAKQFGYRTALAGISMGDNPRCRVRRMTRQIGGSELMPTGES